MITIILGLITLGVLVSKRPTAKPVPSRIRKTNEKVRDNRTR